MNLLNVGVHDVLCATICFRWRKLHKRGHVEEQRVTETPSDSETESFVTPETQVKRKATSLEML